MRISRLGDHKKVVSVHRRDRSSVRLSPVGSAPPKTSLDVSSASDYFWLSFFLAPFGFRQKDRFRMASKRKQKTEATGSTSITNNSQLFPTLFSSSVAQYPEERSSHPAFHNSFSNKYSDKKPPCFVGGVGY
jgi:hypothetical protein